MDSILLVLLFLFKHTVCQNFSVPVGCFSEEDMVTLRCETAGYLNTVFFRKDSIGVGYCFSSGACSSTVTGYMSPVRQGDGVTELVITKYNETRDSGSWVCTYGSSTSDPVNVMETPCRTLSTHLNPTSDVGRSSLAVATDGGIYSLNTLSNSPDETMTFISAITDTSLVFFQTSTIRDISTYYISNHYTSTYLMNILTTNIFSKLISLPHSSSEALLGRYSESSLKSNFDSRTSDLSIFSSNNDLFSSFSIIDVHGSSNFSSLSKIHHVDSIAGMILTTGNRISSLDNSGYMSGLKSLTSISLPDSLTQDLRSQITPSPYDIFSTQKGIGSQIDHTPPTSFPYTDNLQLSVEISYQPSLSPSFTTHLAGLNTQSLLYNHSMQSKESLTVPTTLSNLDTNSILLTAFTPGENSSSKYISFVDLKSSFYVYYKTKDGIIGTDKSKIIETMTLNSIAESHEIKSAKISMNYDYSSNMLINSPITSFRSTSGTLIVHPTKNEINTSIDSFFETFEDRPSTMSNINTERLFESSWIAPSTSFNHMRDSLSLHSGKESDIINKVTYSDNSVLFDSFSVLPEKDSNNVLSITPDVVVWSSEVSRISLVSLSPIWSSSNDSTAYLSTKYMSSISVNSDKYSSATNAHLSQPKDFVSTILPSVSNYFYFSDDINTASSLLLVSSSVNANPVLTYGPSLTKSSKVIAISVTVVGCILFVAITILVLFVLKLLQCKSRSKVSKTNKKFSKTDSNSLSISTGGRRGTSLFDKPYGLPTRYYDKTATSWGVNDNQFTCTYNKNWDDIT